MAKISQIKAREILDSRAQPTLAVDLILSDGAVGHVSVPAGVSRGVYEAVELRDGDQGRYQGMGVLKACENVKKIFEKLKNQEFSQEELDKTLIELDGTREKKNLGANTILGVSLAFAKAMANSQKIPLYRYFAHLVGREIKETFPTPLLNFIEGGVHAINNLEFQEFLIIPSPAPFPEQLRKSVEIFQTLASILQEKAYPLVLGTEGGYAPDLPSNEEAIKILLEAIQRAGYLPERDVSIGIDVASSTFYDEPKYLFEYEKRSFTGPALVGYFQNLAKLYPITLLEDPLASEDWSAWQLLTQALGEKITLVGDDLFVTNKERLERGISMKVANGIVIKPNQIGTLSETLETVKRAQEADYKIVISHRAGETEDTFITDLAFGLGASYLKAGAPNRGERVIKYNRLLEIGEELKER